jgi:DNA-binding response OmpR family regulator
LLSWSGWPRPRDGLGDYLERRGYDIRVAAEAWEADALLGDGDADLAVVDLGAADGAGFDLLRRHGGEGGTPFIAVGGSGDLLDRILALELGAADAVDRPLDRRELAARIGGLLARAGRHRPELLVLEKATVDIRAAIVMHHSGEEDMLSPGQVALLRLFMAEPAGRAQPRRHHRRRAGRSQRSVRSLDRFAHRAAAAQARHGKHRYGARHGLPVRSAVT